MRTTCIMTRRRGLDLCSKKHVGVLTTPARSKFVTFSTPLDLLVLKQDIRIAELKLPCCICNILKLDAPRGTEIGHRYATGCKNRTLLRRVAKKQGTTPRKNGARLVSLTNVKCFPSLSSSLPTNKVWRPLH